MNVTAFRHPLLIALSTEILANPIDHQPAYAPTADLWQSAGIFATDDAFALTESEPAQRGDLGILSRHARPLSWLFFELRTDSRLNGGPGAEREFFGRLADTANAFLAAHQPEEPDWRPLLLAVLREAGEIQRERVARFATPARRRPRPARLTQRLLVAA